MSDNLLILGRQPALGVAELESLYGTVTPFGENAALVTQPVDFQRLGGSIKLAEVLVTLPAGNWKNVEGYLLKNVSRLIADRPEGKLQLGLSAYGFNETAQRINATGLSVKKVARKTGRSVRLSPNTTPALSSAQVFHNHLTGDKGLEFIAITDSAQIIIARTTAVQDIDSYTLRDRGRPKRDTRVGMLPPKLAQIIINLAVDKNREQRTENKLTVLDPFCGTGVVLQEAMLNGYNVVGTDIEPRMIEYSRTNLEWFTERSGSAQAYNLAVGDATSFTWEQPVDAVACETYLGRPFTTTPDSALLAQTVTDCNLIIKKFLRNIHGQLKPGTRLCIAVPAWQLKPGQFRHLPLVDSLEEMGYNRVKFKHVRDEQLLYYREDQIVARELIVITRK